MRVQAFILPRRSSIRDPKIQRIVETVNGPLMKVLAEKAKYHDACCVDLFRDGAPIVGEMAK